MNSGRLFSLGLTPADPANAALAERVHPDPWVNPTPAGRYNLVVLGAGTAGLVAAAGAAGLGAKVALVERHLMGGDCLNTGCVPSKSLLAAARAITQMRRAAEWGMNSAGVEVDFAGVMGRLRRVRASISRHDSAVRFRDLGVDVYFGEARFTGPRSVQVGEQTLDFHRAIVATGARPVLPAIPGLSEALPLTNETLFNLTARPARLVVLGAGPVGCEMAQAFQRLGSRVTLIDSGVRILHREEAEAAEVLARRLVADGVEVRTRTVVTRVEGGAGTKRVHVRHDPEAVEAVVEADEILVGAGRVPNVADLGLGCAGVAFDSRKGVQVDDFLRTTNPVIYAAGDVCLGTKFTHAADFSARLAIQNALFAGRRRVSALTIPWCTYTDPEVAHVGLYPEEAQARGLATDAYERAFNEVDRAVTDGETEGFVRILVRRGTDLILGATVVGGHAGDLISEISVAMAAGMGLGRLASVIHPYPTLAEAIRQCGDAYQRTRLTPFVRGAFRRWFKWRRGGP